MSGKLRAALYARTSTTDQQSIPAQLEDLRSFCERKGWTISHEFTEQLSGADDKRPERGKVLNLVRRHKVDVVLVWRLSRWSRSVLDLFHTLNEITGAGAAFVSTSEGFDLSTPTGRMVAGLLAVIAQFDREILNEGVKFGIAEYRRKHGGKWGRSKTPARALETLRQMWSDGESAAAIIKATGLKRSTVYQYLRELKSQTPD